MQPLTLKKFSKFNELYFSVRVPNTALWYYYGDYLMKLIPNIEVRQKRCSLRRNKVCWNGVEREREWEREREREREIS